MIGSSWKAKAIRAGVLALAGFGFLVQRLSSLWGVFFLAVLALYISKWFFGVIPLSGVELLNVFSSEKDLLGVAVASILAYAALSTWKDQKRVELRIAAGGELLAHFNEVMGAATDIVLYAEGMLELRDRMERSDPADEVIRDAGFLFSDIGEYVDARERLTLLHQKATKLRGTHYALLASSFMALALYDKALTRLELVSRASWLVHPREAEDGKAFAEFVGRVGQAHVDGWRRCSNVYHENAFSMLGFVGGVNGKFVSSLFPLTWTMLLDAWRTSRKLALIKRE